MIFLRLCCVRMYAAFCPKYRYIPNRNALHRKNIVHSHSGNRFFIGKACFQDLIQDLDGFLINSHILNPPYRSKSLCFGVFCGVCSADFGL